MTLWQFWYKIRDLWTESKLSIYLNRKDFKIARLEGELKFYIDHADQWRETCFGISKTAVENKIVRDKLERLYIKQLRSSDHLFSHFACFEMGEANLGMIKRERADIKVLLDTYYNVKK